jgi:hypothetical protein
VGRETAPTVAIGWFGSCGSSIEGIDVETGAVVSGTIVELDCSIAFDGDKAVDCEGWLERLDFRLRTKVLNLPRLGRELDIAIARIPVNKAGKGVLKVKFGDRGHTSR